ncbi:hypothetical protein GCM10008024_09450 [Allgaiera indica]|uniref:Uncharacterized protein n=1 Tax=Allgaiera indica TaxID=765699 RepID=A0AAN4ZZD9_9RHOB|nr:hypothetical protein GCM10008024_09450 [Allgaiera indica]
MVGAIAVRPGRRAGPQCEGKAKSQKRGKAAGGCHRVSGAAPGRFGKTIAGARRPGKGAARGRVRDGREGAGGGKVPGAG